MLAIDSLTHTTCARTSTSMKQTSSGNGTPKLAPTRHFLHGHSKQDCEQLQSHAPCQPGSWDHEQQTHHYWTGSNYCMIETTALWLHWVAAGILGEDTTKMNKWSFELKHHGLTLLIDFGHSSMKIHWITVHEWLQEYMTESQIESTEIRNPDEGMQTKTEKYRKGSI